MPPTWCSVLSPQICPPKTLQHPYPGIPNYLGFKISDHLSHRIPLNICWFTQINQCIPLLIFITSNISTILFMFLSLEFPKLNSCMHKKYTKNQSLLEDTSWRHSSHQAKHLLNMCNLMHLLYQVAKVRKKKNLLEKKTLKSYT